MHYLEKENVFWSGNVWPQAYAMQAGFILEKWQKHQSCAGSRNCSDLITTALSTSQYCSALG